MANTVKRKGCFKSFQKINSRFASPDLDEIKSQKKRRRFSTLKVENESSTDSFLNSSYIHFDSEGSSDSDFEEHPYSRSHPHLNQRLDYHRLNLKSDLNNHISQLSATRDSKDSKRSKCTSKNAVMARLNRLKKKKYIEDLETKNAELKAENHMLQSMLNERAKEIESLKRKTLNLENVIRNSTEIGSLLKCVRQHTDLEISSSLLRNQPNSCTITEVKAHNEKPCSSHLDDLETSPSEEEALVAAVLWGMALHTFCQPYKWRTSDILTINSRTKYLMVG